MNYLKFKNPFLAILSGVLLALSFPTYGFPFLLFFAFVPLLLLEHEISINKPKKSSLKILFYSYLTFLIWNAIVYHWLWFVEVNRVEAYFFPLIFNSLFMTITFMLYHFVKKSSGTYYGLAFFIVVWICFEYLHLNWELNWPWLNLGNAFADFHQTIQWYQFTGTLGGTFWVLFVNILVFYYWKLWLVTRNKIQLKKIIYTLLLGVVFPVIISLSMYYSYEEKSIAKAEVVLLQPEVDPYNEKYEQSATALVSQLINLSELYITPKTQFVLAPETAFPGRGSINFNHKDEDYLLKGIIDFYKTKNQNITFISGVEFEEVFPMEQPENPAVFLHPYTKQFVAHYNSTLQINAKDSLQFYHKSKLVPGVEGFPYIFLLKPILGNAMLNFGGTTHRLGISEEAKVFHNSYNSAKVAPTICYESVFGEKTSEFVKKGANVIFISTNDSWWQNSQGHKQLLAYAKLRAIENRRAIARAANSGTSAFINQRGDIVSSLKYGLQGALRGTLSLNNSKTFYSQNGDYIARIALFLFGILLAYPITQWLMKKLKLK